MAKRKTASTRPAGRTTTSNDAETTAGALEQRAMALAEELGRIAGTLHAKAEGWMDRAALAKQIASVRDSAAELLEQVGGAKAASDEPSATASRQDTPARKNTKGRSGGVVDAPGKRHRKPLPPDPDVPRAASQAAKMRTAKTMVKTNRRRGRG